MGTDAIVNERIEQHLRNITKREEIIKNSSLDDDVARAEAASIQAE
jgi:3-dehydroquinate dehydratase